MSTVNWRQSLSTKTLSIGDVMTGIITFVVQATLIASGALLIKAQMKIKEDHPDDSVVLNYTMGSILIVVGSILVLYSIFQLMRPSRTYY